MPVTEKAEEMIKKYSEANIEERHKIRTKHVKQITDLI